MAGPLTPGAVHRWERTITEEDILRFAELSGDKGRHHLERDAKGRLLAHGLLTATLPTKLGGDLDYIARTMLFEFLRPVYAGDRLSCAGTVRSVESKPRRVEAVIDFTVENQDGRTVLRGETTGYVRGKNGG